MVRPLLGILLVLVIPASASAQAWMRGAPSARATGLAGAGVAIADGADAVFFNPAGLADVPGTTALASAAFDARDVSLRGFDRSVFEGERVFDPGGGLFLSHVLAEGLSGGIGVFTPWGFEVEWEDPEAFPGKFVAVSSYLRALDVSAALAWRIDERWSVGGGLDVIDAEFETVRFEHDPELSALGGGAPIPLAESSVDLAANAIGWNVGVRGRPIDELVVGARYRGRIELDLVGAVDFTDVAPASLRDFRLPDGTRVGDVLDARFEDQVARLDLVLPRGLAFGAAYDATSRLRIVAEAAWTDWSDADALALEFPDPELSDGIPLAYDDAWTVRGGAEYRDPTGIVLRTGYAREGSPAPTRGVNPLLPDADRNTFTIGAGWQWNRIEIDAGYRISLFDDREGVALPLDAASDGIYETVEHRFALGIARRL